MTWKARGVAALTAITLALAISACAPASPANRAPAGTSASANPAPAAFAVTSNVAADAKDVPVDTLLKVSASTGALKDVAVTGSATDRNGKTVSTTVKGSVGADGSWTASERLDPATTYTVVSTGSAPAGESSLTSTFTTTALSLKQQIYVTITNQSGSTYGVAMPVIVQFDLPVKDKKAFEQNLKITTVPAQNGSWGWVSDREVQWRPQDYFQPGTKVSVKADLNGVSAGNGTYGQNSASADFTIGQSRITKVDLGSKQLTQYVNGQSVATIPVSGGKQGDETRSGTSVAMEKLPETRMASETVGIANNSPDGYDLMVKYAIRITTSGEFLHAAPWNQAYFGNTNASHGCVGMSTADAQKIFGIIQVGDPVVVSGTNRSLDDGNGWTAWNDSWQQWQARSAQA
ncbi:L,D-transpeptidase [Raineyella fluvialis]|uniref:L,D-transpeptidase family protein n=1 Tax=Raineyella fluvialis TaxID=2662261 RepID=A0A5Q2FCY5_9ACTN|nr:Ig-like domain-containing protein [Raineyella fluvialis]QGF22565.1 L,D-transpeptidase family protein [Raineyella fluvialis]